MGFFTEGRGVVSLPSTLRADRRQTGSNREWDMRRDYGATSLRQRFESAVLQWCAFFCSRVQNGCFVGTNSTRTFFTNVFSHRAHSSIPPCPERTVPMMINAFLLPSLAASPPHSSRCPSRHPHTATPATVP